MNKEIYSEVHFVRLTFSGTMPSFTDLAKVLYSLMSNRQKPWLRSVRVKEAGNNGDGFYFYVLRFSLFHAARLKNISRKLEECKQLLSLGLTKVEDADGKPIPKPLKQVSSRFFRTRICLTSLLPTGNVTILNELSALHGPILPYFSEVKIADVDDDEKAIAVKTPTHRVPDNVSSAIKKTVGKFGYSLRQPITMISKREFEEFDGLTSVSNSQEKLASSTDETVPTLPFKSASIADDIHTLAVAAERICDFLSEIADKGITSTFGNK